MANIKGRIADGSNALWNGDLLQISAFPKGRIADGGYSVAVQLCGYVDVVEAACWFHRAKKFCDGCITVCIYRIGILVNAIGIAGCTTS